jgi:branched-subunit amino acid aminotransferase/4-amino-4-deoxychorismate lyase
MSLLVCRNGAFIPREDAALSISDGGFLFGDSLFETLRAQGQQILLRKEHLDRLELSARLLDFPWPRPAIETALKQLAAALTAPASRIRLTLSRGAHRGLAWPDSTAGWFLLTAVPYSELSAAERQAGADAVVPPNRRVNPLCHLPQMKRGNYADCLYAAAFARRQGVREALFVEPDGAVLEGATSNLFALIDGKLVTPPLGNLVLNGITRRQVIAAATELGLLVVERKLPLDELYRADEAFLCNSLIDLLPLRSIDGQALQRGESWRGILKTLRLRIET